MRYARVCSNKNDFVARSHRQSSKLEKQGFKKRRLQKSFAKFYRSHFDETRKYGATMKELREPRSSQEKLKLCIFFIYKY